MQGTHAGSGRECNGRRWEQERTEQQLQAGDRWWLAEGTSCLDDDGGRVETTAG